MKFGKKKEKMNDNEDLKMENQELPKNPETEDTPVAESEENNENQCPDAVVDTIESLQLKVNEWQDKYTRLFADFENFKKRMRQERFDLLQTAGSELMLDILPVIDDFERGFASLETATDVDSVRQSYELIYNKLVGILKQKGLEPIESLNEPFDTDLHEAVTMIESPEMKGKVVDVILKGYKMRDKVIRYAKVVVGN